MKRITDVRFSELQTYGRCSQQWEYEYRQGLVPRKLNFTMERGTLGHLVLEALDNNESVTKTIDLYAQKVVTDTPDLTREDIEQLYALAKSVSSQTMEYAAFYPAWDKVLATEVNLRTQFKKWPVPLNSRLDLIVEYKGDIWGVERKWVNGQFRTDEMLELDGQTLAYTLNARANGWKIKGIIYDQINLPPSWPTLNKDGTMSRVKKGDWRTYRKALIAAGLDPASYADMEEALPYTSEFKRNLFAHTPQALKWYGEKELTAKIRAVSKVRPQVVMCEDRIRCSSCRWRDLCLARLNGYDENAARRMFHVNEDKKVVYS